MVRSSLQLAFGILSMLSSACWGQTFENVTIEAGITHNAVAPNLPFAPTFAQVQAGGAAAGDYDGDGWVDLYVTRYFDTDLLYRNNGDGTFSDATASVFSDGIGNWETNGAAWGDIDNDGDLDLAVSTINESQHLLFINDGNGQLTEQSQARNLVIRGGLATTAGTSFSMGDYDRDGYLDLYVTEWRDFTTNSDPLQARLFRNLGAVKPGHFEDVTNAAGVSLDFDTGNHAGKGLSFTPRFVDFDRDGHLDLGVVSDGGTSRLFWNNGDGSFSEGTQTAGINTGTNDMGYTVGDFNGDGFMDWFATSIGVGSGSHPSGNRLFLNNGDRTFADVTNTGVREGGWGWGAEALDFDNDGDLDIAMTNGMTLIADDQSVLFENIGTPLNPQFINRATEEGIVDTGQGRGLLDFDYDRDGDLDLLIINYDSAPVLYRNESNESNSWLQVETVGTQSNRSGIGTIITVTPDLAAPASIVVAEIDGSSNYLSQSELIAHLGLGELQVIDQLHILWPSGFEQTFVDIAVNQRLHIVEGLLADFDQNDQVDERDLLLWQEHYGDLNPANNLGDADRDGDVDAVDFLLWQRQSGRSVASGIISAGSVAQVPEPQGIVALLLLGALLSHTSRELV